ncbi:hypothetical protein [Bacillus seohaeanensis]|uniref:Uncharacterized protein n=1 Tax=Bacillus seohaeanensis TaxID=284580 RepID=A0ABW5RRK4_9BACI
MKTILRYAFFIVIIYIAFFLYQKQLGAIPFLLLSLYLFYESFREYKNGIDENGSFSGGKTP